MAGNPPNVTVGPVDVKGPDIAVASVAIPADVVPRFVRICNGTTKFELVQSVFVFKRVVTVRLSVTRLIVPEKYLARKFTVIPVSGDK